MKKKKKIGVTIFIIVLVLGAFFLSWASKPENLRELKNQIREVFSETNVKESYNAKSLVLVDLNSEEIFISKKAKSRELPASLAKLFVIEYASTLVGLEDIVKVNQEALSFTKEGSSIANIKEKNYYVENLYAAMLVPSGNDAAYALADYCGSILSPNTTSSEERIRIFMNHLNGYLKEQGYKDTYLNDPSGYDMEAYTTVLDLKEVVKKLLSKDWFRDIVSKSTYTAILPDGTAENWTNTNTFLNKSSEYYNENVFGIKTGSLADDYNLVVLYKKHDKEFLICSLGSESNSSRYDDVNYILQTIDESNYLKN